MLESGSAAAKREAAKMEAAKLKRTNSISADASKLTLPGDAIPEYDYPKLVKRIQELEQLVLNLRDENRALKEQVEAGQGGGGGDGDDDDDAAGALPGQPCSG